ncbi:hypothetical protein D9Q98_007468 [Chlorella vulgaris]|uniref:RNA-binding S4 domain-containing protein n=1 Tax=Chlorella vulgaris TaxID=3077 RepID=A0A9D4TM53_CHLVU|nr:hypothetical protein D9Q98_007468 [Chlorella vulgaris]
MNVLSLSSCRRSGGLFLQPPRPSQQHATAPPRQSARAAVAASQPWDQAARQAPGAERQEGRSVPPRRGRSSNGSRSGSTRGPVRQHGGGTPESDILRLNKAIAAAGLASRRGADELVFEGKVKVNGKVVKEPGTQVDLRKDKVAVNGREISTAAVQRKFYFALNKPKGFICSNKSEHDDGGEGRLVINLFDDWLARWQLRQARIACGGGSGGPPPRLFTVGRLDAQSVGLIFVTNDGDWAHKVMHPSSGITKEYSVTLDRKPRQEQLEAMAEGCLMGTPPVLVQPLAVIRDDTDSSKMNRIRVIVAEGRNREVRNLVEHAGLEVKTLRRVRIGGYRLPRDLPFGKFLEMRPHDVRRTLNVGADRML